MVQPIEEAGYQSIRDWITSSSGWDYISVLNDTGGEITRIEISSDSRASWVHSTGAQVLEVEVQLSGGDSDIDEVNGVTIAGTASHDVSSGGDQLATETFEELTIDAAGEEAILVHQIEAPEV